MDDWSHVFGLLFTSLGIVSIISILKIINTEKKPSAIVYSTLMRPAARERVKKLSFRPLEAIQALCSEKKTYESLFRKKLLRKCH